MMIQPKSCSGPTQLAACASLMASSPPWSELFFSRSQCLENLSSPHLELHVVGGERDAVAFLATRATGMEGEPLLEYICVAPSHRGQGVGTALMQYFEEVLYPTADNLFLFVSDINPGAIRLYERLGYVRVGELPNYNLIEQTEYLYRKYRRPRQERFRDREGTRLPRSPKQVLASPMQPLSTAFLNLTEHQNEGIALGAHDLATGYPQLPLPDALRNEVIAGTRAALEPFGSDGGAKDRLYSAVSSLLKLQPQHAMNCRVTFSGSIALDRVFAAIRELARKRNKMGCSAVIVEPCIDLYHNLLSESPGTRVIGIRPDLADQAARIDMIIDALESEAFWHRRRQLLVILDSPSNPYGWVASRDELRRLAEACGRLGALLVVDHCFMITGVHAPAAVPSVFEIDGDTCDWIAVWDTGKSIDLAGDKVGFVVSGSESIAVIVDESLAIVQPSTFSARRAIEVFSRVLASPELPRYLALGGDYCRQNLEQLEAHRPSGWTLHRPLAGNFACLIAPDVGASSDACRETLLRYGLSTAAGRTFMPATIHHLGESPSFIRATLLRTPDYFRESMRAFRELATR